MRAIRKGFLDTVRRYVDQASNQRRISEAPTAIEHKVLACQVKVEWVASSWNRVGAMIAECL